MFSVSNILCNHQAGNEKLRYSHRSDDQQGRAPRPVVVWHVTKACNLRCVHCYASADANPAEGELSFDEGRHLLAELKDYGVPAVLFSGGEPLVRPDVFDLLGYAKKLGLSCTLSTNGTLIDDSVAQRLADVQLKYAGISIDGLPDLHDKLRGKKGAYDLTIKGIEACQKQGIKVGVRFTVHALNAHHMDQIIDNCAKMGIDRLCIYHLAYAGRGNGMQKVDLSTDETRDVIDRIFDKTRKMHAAGYDMEVLTVGNHADAAYAILKAPELVPDRAQAIEDRLMGTGGNRSGSNICSIDPVGDVHYDQFSWHHTVGNIRQETFREIWEEPTNKRLQILRDRTSHLPSRCQGCRFLSLCNGNLRTRAESASGDWLGMDPSCYLTDAEIAQPSDCQLAGV